MTVPISKWYWSGEAGHGVFADHCRFHLSTRVGDYRISTIGDYRPPHMNGERDTLGVGGRTFETFVFRIVGECECGDERCRQGRVDFSEIDTEPAFDYLEAQDNHMAVCRRYAKK